MNNKYAEDETIEEALKKMIEDGLVEETMINGEPHYRLTDAGSKLAQAAGLDPKLFN